VPDLRELGVADCRQAVAADDGTATIAHPTANVLVSRSVRRGVGWGFGWCAAFNILRLGVGLTSKITGRALRVHGWGFMLRGFWGALRPRGIGSFRSSPAASAACHGCDVSGAWTSSCPVTFALVPTRVLPPGGPRRSTYGRYGGASPQPHRGTGACSTTSAPACEFPSANRVPHSR
jgi:hypothetical protein